MEFKGAITAFLPSRNDADRLADILGRDDYTADDMHVTLTYLGGEYVSDSRVMNNRNEIQRMARRLKPFDVQVSGVGYLGNDDAIVTFLQAEELIRAHESLKPLAPPSKFPGYIPHLTLGYGGSVDTVYSRTPVQLKMSYLAVFAQGDRYVYALSG